MSRVLSAIGGLSLLLLSVPAYAAAADDATGDPTDDAVTIMTVTSDEYLPSMSEDEAEELVADESPDVGGALIGKDANGKVAHRVRVSNTSAFSTIEDNCTGEVTCVAPDGADGYGTFPMRVASGHVLWGNSQISQYIYKSDKMHNERLVCRNGTCVASDDIEVWFKQTVVGDSSTRWKHEFFKRRHIGTTPYSSPFWHNCAVNIAGDEDQYCSTYRDNGANGEWTGSNYANGYTFYRTWGAPTSGSQKRYPILTLSTHYSGEDGTARAKFRGWDVCLADDDNKLCSATGTGA